MNIISKSLLLASVIFLSGCDSEVLLSNLTQRQSSEILAILNSNGIEGTRRDNGKLGQSVQVSSEDFATAVDLVRYYNLPTKDPVEIIQAFPGDALVASPQAERTRLLSLIEQRLEQSLLTIPGVTNARVHLSYPINVSKQTKVQQYVSALVTYSGTEQHELLMNKIKLFLTNSFTDTNYDNVSVVIVERPALQQQVKAKANTAPPIIISAIVALSCIVIITICALMFSRRKTKTSDVTESKQD